MSGVTVVLPAYNEAKSIGDVVAGCWAHVSALDEVLVIDDGSTDGTARKAREAGARVLSLARNSGKGRAVLVAFDQVRTDRIVLLDADGQDHPEDIPRLLDALEPGVDLVLGSRFLGDFEPGAITSLNRLGTRFLTGTMNRLFNLQLTDPLAGFRALRRDSLHRWRPSARGFDIEMDLVLSVVKGGGRVVEVPVRRSERSAGASHLKPWSDGPRILKRVLAHRLSLR